MKALIAAAVLSFATVTQAGTWEYVGHGVYRGDSYYWHAYQVCGCWKYEKLCAVVQCPQVGAPGFWEKMAELGARTDELQSQAEYVKSRYPGRYPVAANYETTGYSVLQQGYVQGGSTPQSTGPAYFPIDLNAAIHEAQRIQELAGVNSSQANAQVNTIVNSAVEGNSAAARIMAAGQVAAATIAASVPPVQQTTVFQSKQVQASSGPPNMGPAGDSVSLLSHGLLMQNCAGCHSPRKLSGNLDLTVDPAALVSVRDLIEKKIVSGEMPKGHPHLSEAVVNGLLAGIPRQTFAATPPIPQPPAETPKEKAEFWNNVQPPLPPQGQ